MKWPHYATLQIHHFFTLWCLEAWHTPVWGNESLKVFMTVLLYLLLYMVFFPHAHIVLYLFFLFSSCRMQTGVSSLQGGVFIRRVCQEAALSPLLSQWMHSAVVGAGKSEEWMCLMNLMMKTPLCRFVQKILSVSDVMGCEEKTLKKCRRDAANFSAWTFTCFLFLPVTAWYLPSVPKKPWRRWQQPPANIRTPRSTLPQDRATGEAGDLRNVQKNSTSSTTNVKDCAPPLRP